MTKLLERALERVRAWPKHRQDEAARLLLAMDRHDAAPYQLSPAERAEIRAALKDVDAGDFASDEDVATVFRRYGV